MEERRDVALGQSLRSVDGHTAKETELADLETQERASVAVFKVESVSYERIEALKLACPPTGPDEVFDPVTFGPMFVDECVTEPADFDAAVFFAEWEPWQVSMLFEAAWDVCNARSVVTPLSATASKGTRSSDGKSATAPNVVSDTVIS